MRLPWCRKKAANAILDSLDGTKRTGVSILTHLGGLSREQATARVDLNATLLIDIANGVPFEDAMRNMAARRAAAEGKD